MLFHFESESSVGWAVHKYYASLGPSNCLIYLQLTVLIHIRRMKLARTAEKDQPAAKYDDFFQWTWHDYRNLILPME